MRHLTLTLSLILGLATSVSAEWKNVITSSEINIFVDVDNIRQRDGFVYADQIIDLVGQQYQSGIYRSVKQKLEIDCIARGYRILTSYNFDGYGGSGNSIKLQPNNCGGVNMCYPRKNTIGYIVKEKICQHQGFY